MRVGKSNGEDEGVGVDNEEEDNSESDGDSENDGDDGYKHERMSVVGENGCDGKDDRENHDQDQDQGGATARMIETWCNDGDEDNSSNGNRGVSYRRWHDDDDEAKASRDSTRAITTTDSARQTMLSQCTRLSPRLS